MINASADFCDDLAVALKPLAGVEIETIRQVCVGSPKHVFERLEEGPVTLNEFNNGSMEGNLPASYFLLQRLWEFQALALMNQVDSPDICIRPTTVGMSLDLSMLGVDSTWRLSRFAFLRMASDSVLRIETPKQTVIVDVLNPDIGQLFSLLAKPVTAKQLAKRLPWIEGLSAVQNILLLLRIGSVIDSCDAAGTRAEDKQPKFQQWEFHDLLFHHRSRKGRHSELVGAHYRFKDRLPALPAIKKISWTKDVIALPHPDIPTLVATDPPFTAVLESRSSRRNQNATFPISILQLGEFLYRTARIRERFQTPMGEYIPFAFKNARFEWVDFRGGLGVEARE